MALSERAGCPSGHALPLCRNAAEHNQKLQQHHPGRQCPLRPPRPPPLGLLRLPVTQASDFRVSAAAAAASCLLTPLRLGALGEAARRARRVTRLLSQTR